MEEKIEVQKSNSIVLMSVGIIICTLLAGVLLVYLPFISKYKKIESKIIEERGRNLLIAEVGVLEKHLKAYNNKFSKDRSQAWLLREVSGIASTEHVKILSTKPLENAERGHYVKLSLSLESISSYYELGKFISGLESSDKFLKVDKIEIKRLDTSSDYDKEKSEYKPFDVAADMEISTIVWRD